MSKALPGEHYCRKHQGNEAHYDEKNCTVCKLLASPSERERVIAVEALELIHNSHDSYCENHTGIAQHSHDLANIADEALAEIRALNVAPSEVRVPEKVLWDAVAALERSEHHVTGKQKSDAAMALRLAARGK